MNVTLFFGIAPCSSYMNRCYWATYQFHQPSKKLAKQMPSNLLHAGFLLGYFLTLKMEMTISCETSVYIQTTRLYIPEYGKSPDLVFLMRASLTNITKLWTSVAIPISE
jgi:hypothetical protein